MQANPFQRFRFVQSAALSLPSIAAFALLGLVLAYWMWAWLTPRAEPRAPASAEVGARAESAYALFGSAGDRKGGAPAGAAVRLLGVVAASGTRTGYAVLRVDEKKTIAVLQGHDIEAGLRLAEVHVDHIVLERNGAPEKLAWPEKNRK
jgi:general secretion pathway protein C